MSDIKDGDFVVTRDRWRIDCVRAIRLTKQTVFFIDESWGKPRERRIRIQDVVFSGPEAVAERLCQQLRSSEQQKVNDQQAASERQAKRDESFIAEAKDPHS